ncbi:alanine racemase [Capnocytophaga canimorsus]|uniref:Alanine racemase n=1 Tax=Capnocytophaga canimorsus TaxID=28188 RepID=A0AAD0E7N0_9FLAO|nr:alanine racemase [Capnocytophaga canimorsus]ATA93080.1 alanine racemase [Capnocytophaga canimorsus]
MNIEKEAQNEHTSVQETTLEIRLDNLQHNVKFLKSKLKENTLFMAVVKAFSYGNNHCEIAKYLEKKDLVDYFAVAYASEGVELRKSGVTKPILVLHPQVAHFHEIVTYELEPTLYSYRTLDMFLSFAMDNNLDSYPVHIKCNTGMNRLGFLPQQIENVCQILSNKKQIRVRTAYSHLFASEDKNAEDCMQEQIRQFIDCQKVIEKYFSYKVLFHNCNTSGILNYPQAHFDMVRSGIGMYGFGNDAEYQSNFRPITILKSLISQIHDIPKGGYVGYNFGFQADAPTRTATISVGHADGLNRIYGKGIGFVYINDKKAPIVGNVCMDMLMVDITEIDCKEGDEVIIFDEKHTAEILAETAQTISYELITSLSRRIKRVYVE